MDESPTWRREFGHHALEWRGCEIARVAPTVQGFPGTFEDEEHARLWTRRFVDHYNQHRPHEGIALSTPADVLLGLVDHVHRVRELALDAKHADHPEEYIYVRPTATRDPEEVRINPELARPAEQLLTTAGALKPPETPLETGCC